MAEPWSGIKGAEADPADMEIACRVGGLHNRVQSTAAKRVRRGQPTGKVEVSQEPGRHRRERARLRLQALRKPETGLIANLFAEVAELQTYLSNFKD